MHRAEAARANIHFARLAIRIDRLSLNIDSEHAVRPALGVAHIVAEAGPSTALVTLTSHRLPLYQRLCSNVDTLRAQLHRKA